MKKKTVFGTVLFVLLVLQAQTVFANGESESSSRSSGNTVTVSYTPQWRGVIFNGENDTLLEGTTWMYMQQAGPHMLLPVVFEGTGATIHAETFEFRMNGRLNWVGNSTIGTTTGGTVPLEHYWERNDDIIKIVCSSGNYYLEGKYYPQTRKIMGTGQDSRGGSWEFTMEPMQGSFITTTPAPQTNIQPSAPTQSPAPAQRATPALSAPALQTGTYAWSNLGQNMRMAFNAGMVSTFLNNSGIWTGTYSINGNQLVISVTSATGDYSRLRGMTYSYTITSNASFSGSGETWVRTGY